MPKRRTWDPMGPVFRRSRKRNFLPDTDRDSTVSGLDGGRRPIGSADRHVPEGQASRETRVAPWGRFPFPVPSSDGSAGIP
jgi:hypothetical protein